MQKVITISLLAILGSAGVSLAQTADTSTSSSADGNSRHEARRARFMAEADTNGDGELSKEERSAFHAAKQQSHFDKKDTNGDGQLTKDELERMPEALFTKLDKDNSGGLSLEEMPKFHGHRGRHGGHMFRHADQNGDGKLTLAEMTAAAERHFAKLDADSDGVVTQEELKERHGGKHGHHHGHKHGQDATDEASTVE